MVLLLLLLRLMTTVMAAAAALMVTFSFMYLSHLGFVFLNESRTEQQTTFRILFADHSVGSLPGEGDGWHRASHGLELRFYYIRRKQLWHQGECFIFHAYYASTLVTPQFKCCPAFAHAQIPSQYLTVVNKRYGPPDDVDAKQQQPSRLSTIN